MKMSMPKATNENRQMAAIGWRDSSHERRAQSVAAAHSIAPMDPARTSIQSSCIPPIWTRRAMASRE